MQFKLILGHLYLFTQVEGAIVTIFTMLRGVFV